MSTCASRPLDIGSSLLRAQIWPVSGHLRPMTPRGRDGSGGGTEEVQKFAAMAGGCTQTRTNRGRWCRRGTAGPVIHVGWWWTWSASAAGTGPSSPGRRRRTAPPGRWPTRPPLARGRRVVHRPRSGVSRTLTVHPVIRATTCCTNGRGSGGLRRRRFRGRGVGPGEGGDELGAGRGVVASGQFSNSVLDDCDPQSAAKLLGTEVARRSRTRSYFVSLGWLVCTCSRCTTGPSM